MPFLPIQPLPGAPDLALDHERRASLLSRRSRQGHGLEATASRKLQKRIDAIDKVEGNFYAGLPVSEQATGKVFPVAV